MRKPQDIVVDRALLLYLLHLTDSQECQMVSDVKLQQLVFLSELQMLGKGFRGFHFEFLRFAYGAFSKDLDNDLLALRRKERLENFSLTEESEEVVTILEEALEDVEANEQVREILQGIVGRYAVQDLGEITNSVEQVEISTTDQPDQKLFIRDIPFHSILLVPSRIEVTGELTIPPPVIARLNSALGM